MPPLRTLSPCCIKLLEYLRARAVNDVISGLRQRDLAEALGHHPVQISLAVEYLERNGHVMVLRERSGVSYALTDRTL